MRGDQSRQQGCALRPGWHQTFRRVQVKKLLEMMLKNRSWTTTFSHYFTLFQPEMPMNGVWTGRCDQLLTQQQAKLPQFNSMPLEHHPRRPHDKQTSYPAIAYNRLHGWSDHQKGTDIQFYCLIHFTFVRILWASIGCGWDCLSVIVICSHGVDGCGCGHVNLHFPSVGHSVREACGGLQDLALGLCISRTQEARVPEATGLCFSAD